MDLKPNWHWNYDITILDIIFKYSEQLVLLWWVGPVLCHIYMTEFSRGDSKMFDNEDKIHNM